MNIRVMWGVCSLWIMATVICSIGEGIYSGEATLDTINSLTGFHYLEAQGVLGIPMAGGTLFSNLPTLLGFDYSFLEGGAGWQLLRFLLMSISVGVIYGIVVTFASMFMGVANRLFGQ